MIGLTEQHANAPLLDELVTMGRQAKAQKLRTMKQFAEDEIILPTGRWEGRRFRANRQPYVERFLDLIDDDRWNEIVCVGPSQSGKSLNMFVLPILYHLFEHKESVIAGVVDLDKMAKDKWERDLLPVIERTRYKELIPKLGKGSRGGFGDKITFRNGAELKWMSGGGSDKSRAYFTSRIVCFTEIDELAKSRDTSVEADKIKQIEARTRSYGRKRRVYKECTVTTDKGHIWTRYLEGTASQLMLPCQHCGKWVAPEREHFVGWEDASTDFEAEQNAAFACPQCGALWSDEDRITSNVLCKVVHKGQTINASGKVTGDLPATRTLGFRWSGVNNLFLTQGDIGGDMWKSEREADQDNAERERAQFFWAYPYREPSLSVTRPDQEAVQKRQPDPASKLRRGIVPENTEQLTIGLDIGKRYGHWTAIAFLNDYRVHVIDYGFIHIETEKLGLEVALRDALATFRANVEGGFTQVGADVAYIPDQVWVDAGWQKEERGQADPIYDFMREEETDAHRWKATLGRSRSQRQNRAYTHPKAVSSVVTTVGEQFHFKYVPTQQLFIGEVNVDYWKNKVHERLTMDLGQPGAATLFASPNSREHKEFVKHLTAEELVEVREIGKPVRILWQSVRRHNHWFDSTVLAMAAGAFCGFELPMEEHTSGKTKETEPAGV